MMLAYFSTELLKELLDYYLPRYRLAEERGFAVQGSKYAWLYDELRLRVSTIRQALLFLDSLPKFMECEDNSKPMQYVVSYTSALFAPDGASSVDRGQDDIHPYFNDGNPYWLDFQEAVDNFPTDYDLSNLPLFYVDLCEYVVRAIRLYLQIREGSFHAIDKGKFETIMHANAPVRNAG